LAVQEHWTGLLWAIDGDRGSTRREAMGSPVHVLDDVELPKECATRKQWRIARLLRDRFCKRWVLEYLPTLVRCKKLCRRTEPIRQGDMVFV